MLSTRNDHDRQGSSSISVLSLNPPFREAGTMEEQELLASVNANVQEQDAYEDRVIREATLQLAPQLPAMGGFPDLSALGADAATLWGILAETQRSLLDIDAAGADYDGNEDERDALLLREQVILHYLTTCAGVPEEDLPRRARSAKRRAPGASAAATSEDERQHSKPPASSSAISARSGLHKRVSMMKRKRVEAEDMDDDLLPTLQEKQELKRLRQERLQRKAQRRKEWSSDSSSDEEAEFVEAGTTEESDPPLNDEAVRIVGATSGEAPLTAICPLCQETVTASRENGIDEALAQHMDECQRHGGRRRRRGATPSSARTEMRGHIGSHAAQVSLQKPGAQKKKRPLSFRAPRNIASNPVDDYHEASYEDRVDDWIESGLARMKVMKERDLSEELPGAQSYEGLRIPGWMNDRLFGYQRVALHWMWDLHLQEVGGILGDEMGLGKTVQVCAYLGALASSRKMKSVLIVAPATMLSHWLAELSTWAPGIRRILIHQSGEGDGSSRAVSGRMLSQLAKWLKQSRGDRLYEAIDQEDLDTMEEHSFCGTAYAVVTTYENVRRNSDLYAAHDWSYAVLDEAQKIRNPDAEVTLACKRIRTPHRIAMSGTPIQNDLRELWSLVDFVYPGRLGTLPAFEQEFSDPIRRGGYSNASPMQVQLAYRTALALRDLIEPCLLRRRKKEVKEVARMPAKTEHVLFCRLSRRQRLMYEAYLRSDEVMRVVRGTGQLLAAVTMMRKICNHPDLVIDPDESSLDKFLTNGCVPDLTGDDSEASDDDLMASSTEESLTERSGKLEVLAKILPLWNRQGHRVLIFCQWRKMLNVIQRFLMMKGWKFARLDGNTNVSSRQRLVDTFNTDTSFFCMLCTTRTGGVGLNLTGANRILLYDPDFNPQTDAQARERAWRFGQSREVTVYRLITAGTVEEKIYQRQIFKTALTNSVLQDPRQRRLFSQRDLKDLFTLKADSGSLRGGGDGLTETGEATRGVGVVGPDDSTPVDASKDDEETLRKVMKSKGLAGIFDHGFVEQEPMRKSWTQREMEEQAREAARKAVSALQQSVRMEDARSQPLQETRFASSRASAASQSQSSSRLLATLRQRQAEVESCGRSASPTEESKKHAQILLQIREFVLRRSPSTDEVLEQFEGTAGFDLTVFRQLLKSVARVENGRWHLKGPERL